MKLPSFRRRKGKAFLLRLDKEKGLRIVLLFFSAVVSTLVLTFPFSYRSFSLRVGKPAPFDIRALRTVQYVDEEKSEALRREAASRITPSYTLAPFANAEAEDAIRRTFQLIREARKEGKIIHSQVESLNSRLPFPLSPQAITTLLQTKEDLNRLQERALQIVKLIMEGGIKDTKDEVEAARKKARNLVLRSFPPNAESFALAEITASAIRPNLIENVEATRKLREKARSSVKPVYEKIMFGELIVRKGETITPQIWRKLTVLGIVGKLPPLKEVLAMLALVAISYSVMLLFLSKHNPEVYLNLKLQSLLWLLLFLGFFGFRFGLSFQFTPAIVSAFVAISLASLLGGEVAAISLPFLALLMSISAGGEMQIASMSILSGGVGIVSTIRLRDRFDLVKASLALAGTISLLTLLCRVWRFIGPEELPLALFWGAVSGIIGIAIAWLGVSILERLFGITTTFQLLELANPDKPLLRELLLNAPGSYQHSIITANLAEAAANAIGADALLCRVSALYHDIGKMKRPLYFIENQFGENIHETLSPTLSSIVITSHVRDGVEMAKRAKLPPKVIDIIAQHHGTSLVSYFYHRALGESDGEVEESRFRYEGPKPQSKEAAIVMLADSVEAAVRSLEDKSPQNVEMVVEKIIRQKLNDGQLDESGLSYKDLNKIKEALLSILRGFLHKRLEYPSEEVRVANQDNLPQQNAGKKEASQGNR